MVDPTPPVIRLRRLAATMRDGVVLRADAWVPEGDGQWPVLLQRLPYGCSVASAPVLPHPEQLARRGYAVVIQDVRGRGDSDGQFEPFVDDGCDGADTIEWAARLPFADGRVATYGFSYQGLNQLAAAALRPPSLRAIAPLMCSTEPYADWTYERGCLRWPFVTAWAAQLAAQEPGATPLPIDLDALPIATALGPEPPAWFRDWLDHGLDDSYWAARRPDLGAIDVPVFTVLGYFDDFAAGTQRLFDSLGAEGVCGPWTHMPWGSRLGDVELGPSASPVFAHDALVAFFDRVLGSGSSPSGGVTYYDNVAGWLRAGSWPPPHHTDVWTAVSGGQANSRHGDGRLERGDVPVPLADVFVGQPLVPYPGTLDPLSDEAAAEDRRDVLCYTTDPLDAAVSLVGSVRVHAVVEADVETCDLVVSLVAVGADGTARRLATGTTRIRAAADADHEVVVTLSPFAWTLSPGQRLRADVSSSRFPAFDRNPQSTDQPVAHTPRGGCRVATIHLRQLRVELSTVQSALPTSEAS